MKKTLTIGIMSVLTLISITLSVISRSTDPALVALRIAHAGYGHQAIEFSGYALENPKKTALPEFAVRWIEDYCGETAASEEVKLGKFLASEEYWEKAANAYFLASILTHDVSNRCRYWERALDYERIARHISFNMSIADFFRNLDKKHREKEVKIHSPKKSDRTIPSTKDYPGSTEKFIPKPGPRPKYILDV